MMTMFELTVTLLQIQVTCKTFYGERRWLWGYTAYSDVGLKHMNKISVEIFVSVSKI